MKPATQRGCFLCGRAQRSYKQGFHTKSNSQGCASAARQQQGAHREQAVFAMAFVFRINRRSDRAKNVEEAFLFFSLQKGEATIKEKIKKQPTDCGAAKGQQNHDRNGEAFLACVFFFEPLQPQTTQPGLIRAIERSGIARNRNCLQTILRSVGCSDTQIK